MPFDPTDPDTKAALEAAIAPLRDSVSKLEAKRDEALNEAKLAKAELRKTQDIKPEDFAALEAENDKLKTDLSNATKQVKELAKTAETATKALEAESGATRKLLVENGLRSELAAAGVTNAVHQKAAMAMLSGSVEIVADGETRTAKVGDKALADFVKEWAAGDEGKHFVAAAINGGGGAPGGKGGESGKRLPASEVEAMKPKDRAAFFDAGGSYAEAKAA